MTTSINKESLLRKIEKLNAFGLNIVCIDEVCYNILRWDPADEKMGIHYHSLQGQNISSLLFGMEENVAEGLLQKRIIGELEKLPVLSRFYHKNILFVMYGESRQ